MARRLSRLLFLYVLYTDFLYQVETVYNVLWPRDHPQKYEVSIKCGEDQRYAFLLIISQKLPFASKFTLFLSDFYEATYYYSYNFKYTYFLYFSISMHNLTYKLSVKRKNVQLIVPNRMHIKKNTLIKIVSMLILFIKIISERCFI